MRLAGHCQRHQELPASKLVLWEPTHGHRSRGRPTLTYVDVLKKDSGAQSNSELAGCMEMTGSNDGESWNMQVTRLRLLFKGVTIKDVVTPLQLVFI